MKKLDNKVAIITGGAGGIGKATALEFLNEGSDVLLFDLNESDLKKLCQEIGSNHLSYFAGDVTSFEDNLKAVEIAKEKFGGLDIFVANAGIEGEVNTLENYDIEKFDKVMAVNVKGPFLALKASIPALSARGGGSFIITSSIAGLSGAAQIGAYATSKRVNTINPSPVETRMMRSLEEGLMPGESDQAKDLMLSNIPLGRYGKPEDVAKVMLFLASDDSSFVTGSVYSVDGGSTA